MSTVQSALLCGLFGLGASLILAKLAGPGQGGHAGLALLVLSLLVSGVIGMGSAPEQYSGTEWVMLFGGISAAALGWWEEKHPLRLKWKLAGQVLVATWIYWAGLRVEHFKNPLTGTQYELGAVSYAATLIWLVGTLNIIHLVDAIEELAHMIPILMMALLAYLSFGQQHFAFSVSVAMTGALAGLLAARWRGNNLPIGKGGSYLLGSLTGTMALANAQKGTVIVALLAPVFILCLPLLEAAVAIRRSARQTAAIPQAGQMHARLMQIGFSKVKTAMILHDLSIVGLALAFALSWSQGRAMALFFGVLFLATIVLGIFRRRGTSAVGRVLRSSLELRRQTDYALALSRLLEAQAERAGSIEDLWRDYQFMIRRMGFLDARLIQEDGSELGESKTDTQWLRQKMSDGTKTALALAVRTSGVDPKMTQLLGEMAAEIWVTARTRWERARAGLEMGQGDRGATSP